MRVSCLPKQGCSLEGGLAEIQTRNFLDHEQTLNRYAALATLPYSHKLVTPNMSNSVATVSNSLLSHLQSQFTED